MKEKSIYFTEHARKRMEERKVKEDEVISTIRNNKWQLAEEGRFSTSGIFPFNNYHYGRYYRWKQVVPIFKEEKDRILVITIYSFLFQRR